MCCVLTAEWASNWLKIRLSFDAKELRREKFLHCYIREVPPDVIFGLYELNFTAVKKWHELTCKVFLSTTAVSLDTHRLRLTGLWGPVGETSLGHGRRQGVRISFFEFWFVFAVPS